MKKFLFTALLGLSLGVSSLTVAHAGNSDNFPSYQPFVIDTHAPTEMKWFINIYNTLLKYIAGNAGYPVPFELR